MSPCLLILHLLQSGVENLQEKVHIRLGDAHGRLDPECIGMKTALAREQSQVLHPLEDAQAFLLCRLLDRKSVV